MLFPGVTGLGDPGLVTLRSYWPADATVTFAVALLLEGFESGVAVESAGRIGDHRARRGAGRHIHDQRESRRRSRGPASRSCN